MSMILVPIDTPPVLFGVQGVGEVVYFTIIEIVECLQIAELEGDFPDLPEEWKAIVIPQHRQIETKELQYA